MENNIDKILRNALENHEEMPPSESWMHIHTEIGKQNRRVLTPILAGLFLGVLLISGIGISMYYASKSPMKLSVKTQTTAEPLFIPKNVQNRNLKEVLLAKNNQIMVNKGQSLPLSVSPQTTIGLSSVETQTTAENFVQNLVEKPLKNDSVQYFSEIKENMNLKINEIQPVELLAKGYAYTDLSEKMNEALAGRIDGDYLEEKNTNKDISESDSVVSGNKFSLRHPIISYGFGATRSFWDYGSNDLGRNSTTPYYIANGSTIKINVAWKINKKLRMGIGLSANTFNLGIPNRFADEKMGIITSNVFLLKEFEGKSYTALTPFGYFNIPVSSFKGFPTNVPNVLDSIRVVRYPYSHSMRVTALSVSSQYNLLSKNRKKGKKYGYQLYSLEDLFIQRQTGYSYASLDEKEFLNNLQTSPSSSNGYIFQEGNHLGGTSEYTFGFRVGLGFRYQFARKWDFYLESSVQSTFNSWFKEWNSKQVTLSLQAGINLNL